MWRPAGESLALRVALVLVGECLFFVLVLGLTAAPPAFAATVLFGCGLALLLEVQAARADAAGRGHP